jgi:hypothetical protein
MPISLTFEFRNQRFTDAEKGLRAFAEQLGTNWDGAAKTLSSELKTFLDAVAEALVKRHSGAWPGGTGAQTLSKRSGKLISSIVKSVKVKGSTFDTIEGEIGSDLVYAGIQEFGGTIRAKNVKYLAIPLKAALDGRGLPLRPGPRAWEHTFVARSRAGNLIIFQKRGTEIIPLYVLRTSVTIPPRLGMQKTLNTGLPYFVDRAMDAIVKAVVAEKAKS